MTRHVLSRRICDVLTYIVLIFGLILILFPLYITVVTAFKTPEQSAQNFFSLPRGLYTANFLKIFRTSKFFVYLKNSILITLISLLGEVIIVPLFSYAISRNRKKPYYRVIFLMTIVGLFVPFQVVMLPTVKMFVKLSLLNSLGVILLYWTYTLKKGVFLVVGFLETAPLELEESATIDGCSVMQSYRSIIFPLLTPIIATLLIVDGLWIWNDFLLPLLLLNTDPASWTLPLFQAQFKNEYSFDFNLAFASFLLSMSPIIIFYAFMQRHIISGVTRGAIKG